MGHDTYISRNDREGEPIMKKFNSLAAVAASRALSAARELHSELIEFRATNPSPLVDSQIQAEQVKIREAIATLRAD